MFEKVSTFLLVILSLVAFSSPGVCQDQGEKAEKERVRVTDLLIYDKDGKPVSDVRKSEIEIWENGDKVSLISLEEVRGAEELNPSYEKPSASVGKKNIILWDFRSLSRAQLITSTRIAKAFINDFMAHDDELMLVSILDNLHVIQPFTKNKALLNKTISRMISDGNKKTSLAASAREQAEKEETSENFKAAFRFAANLKVLSSLVDDIDDRKDLILFSNGPGLNPLESANAYLREDSQAAIRELNTANIAVTLLALKEYGNNSEDTLYGDSNIVGKLNSSNQLKKQRSYDFLNQLSIATLGRVIFVGKFQSEKQLLAYLSSTIKNYYLVAFHTFAKSNGDEEYRHVQVKIKGGWGKVAFRNGFVSRLDFGDISEDKRKVHLTQGFDTGSQINELGTDAVFLFDRINPDSLELIFAAECPLEFLQKDEKGRFDFELLLANIKADGTVISSVNKEYVFESSVVDGEVLSPLRVKEILPCKLGINSFKVALRDNISGKRSYFYHNIMFRKPPSDSLILKAPVLIQKIDEDKLGIDIIETRLKEEWTRNYKDAASDIAGFLEFPLLKAEFRNGDQVSIRSAINNPSSLNPAAEDYKIIFAVRSGNVDKKKRRTLNKVIMSSLDMVFSKGRVVIQGDFILKGYPPGDYDLFVVAYEESTGRQNTAHSHFSVLD